MQTHDYILHPATEQSLKQLLDQPTHALLIVGQPGSGKTTVSAYLAAALLEIPEESLNSYPYVHIVRPVDNKAIPIEAIRQLRQFTTLKIPNNKSVARVVIIEDSHMLTVEAQNALLKSIEEPPLNTVFILTAPNSKAVLPTIESRVRILNINPPAIDTVRSYFLGRNFSAEEVDKALLLSGGLPGLTHTVLTNQQAHPLFVATEEARVLLQSSAYERLVRVDALSKQKQLCSDILYILGQMSRMALLKSANGNEKSKQRWQNIMKASYKAQQQLDKNVQPKLVLANLMLDM